MLNALWTLYVLALLTQPRTWRQTPVVLIISTHIAWQQPMQNLFSSCIAWQLVLIAYCEAKCCSEPSLLYHFLLYTKICIKSASLPHHIAFVSFPTFASSLWEWWCLIHGFPHSRHCHHSLDSAARTGWRSLANPNWCPKRGLSLWKRHYEKESSFKHV